MLVMPEQKWRHARAKAIEVHGDQRYGGLPYVVHLDEVATVLATHGERGLSDLDNHLTAAYLHDSVEDCGLTQADLLVYGHTVFLAVMFCTDEPGATRQERKAATYARCSKAIHEWTKRLLQRTAMVDVRSVDGRSILIGLRVKLSDRIANLRACMRDPAATFQKESGKSTLLSMYLREDQDFKIAYGRHHAFVSTMLCEFWREYDALVRHARDVQEEPCP